jgi:hypothetical protein
MSIIWSTRDITPSQQGLRVQKDFWYNSGAPDIAQTYRLILAVRPSPTSGGPHWLAKP